MSEDRKVFSFYRSYYEASKDLPTKEDQADFLMAICSYIFEGVEPEIHGVASAMFKLAKPNLEMSIKRANAGAIGGSKKQNTSKTKANEKQNESNEESNANLYMINDYKINDKEKILKKESEVASVFSESGKEIIKLYEERFGVISTYKAQQLDDLVKDFGKDAVAYAVRQANISSAPGIRYIRTTAMNYVRRKEDGTGAKPITEPVADSTPRYGSGIVV